MKLDRVTRPQLAARLLAGAILLLISAHRMPAPIVEETPAATAAPAKPKPKPKSIQREPDSISEFARHFIGTWTASPSMTLSSKATSTAKNTLLIGERNAVVISEFSIAPPPGGTWSDLPATINTMPYQLKATSRSNDLRSDGMHLTIVWKPPQFSDWFPKESPVNFRQKFENDFKTIRAAHPSATYVLSGDEMVAEAEAQK